jgi:hypothetical protein
MVFQEQLSQAAIHLAGFDPAEADTLLKGRVEKDFGAVTLTVHWIGFLDTQHIKDWEVTYERYAPLELSAEQCHHGC